MLFRSVLNTVPAYTGHFHSAMVIDDNDAFRIDFIKTLAGLGINTVSDLSINDFQFSDNPSKPDIIFLSVENQQGMELIEQISKSTLTKKVPIALITMENDLNKYFSIEISIYLKKPVNLDNLIRELNRISHLFPTGNNQVFKQKASFAGRKILIMDFNDASRKSFTDFLVEKEINVIFVEDVSIFIEKIKTETPDLIIFNSQITGFNGLESLRLIRSLPGKNYASVPIITLSSVLLPDDKERFIDAGADEYILKPLVLNNFLEMLKKYFEYPLN